MTPKRILLAVGLFLTLLVGIATVAVLLYEEPEERFLPERHILPQQPVTDVPIKPAREAADSLNPAELVLGVVVNGEARAYPLNRLNAHPARKVVNDRLGGRPVLATWCDACFNGIVFARDPDGRELTFAVAGQLWKQSMVLYDVETGSRWSHFLGEAKLGPLTGRRLEVIPSMLADWRGWREQYPEGTVALPEGTQPGLDRTAYREPGRFVLGIAAGKEAKAWGLDRLGDTPVINDDWQGRPVAAVFDRASAAARLYERAVAGQVLTFRWDERGMADDETGSSWDPLTGRAVSGPLAGSSLTPLPALVSYRDAWLRFHPRSD